MKHFAIILALCATSQAYGQRLVDIELKLTSPVANATITSGTQFTASFTVKNVGTTPMKATDTVAFLFTLDGNGQDFNNDGQPDVFISSGTALAPNATAAGPSVGITYTIPASMNGSTHQFGVAGTIINRSTDSAIDNNTSNNTSANPVIFGGTNSVNELKGAIVKHSVLSVYPNPAVSAVNAKIDLGATSTVSYRLADITGRTVLSGDQGKLGKGEHVIRIPLPAILPGLYLFQVVIGDAVISTDKLYITQ